MVRSSSDCHSRTRGNNSDQDRPQASTSGIRPRHHALRLKMSVNPRNRMSEGIPHGILKSLGAESIKAILGVPRIAHDLYTADSYAVRADVVVSVRTVIVPALNRGIKTFVPGIGGIRPAHKLSDLFRIPGSQRIYKWSMGLFMRGHLNLLLACAQSGIGNAPRKGNRAYRSPVLRPDKFAKTLCSGKVADVAVTK